jgi:hypothetical protein
MHESHDVKDQLPQDEGCPCCTEVAAEASIQADPLASRVLGWLKQGITRRRFIAATATGILLGPTAANAAVKEVGVCGPPPPPPPANASAAEGLPPLPLPATPQRRSEKKKPPRPPVIAVKIKTGELADWATDPNDINNLLIWMKASLGVNFTYDEKPLNEVDLEAGDVPVLYRTGHNEFSFSENERQRLRAYLLRGGMIIFDSCCGRKGFADSARKEIKLILPEYDLNPLGIDHPLFNCYYENAGTVRFTPSSLSNNPSLRSPGPCGIEGIEISCRSAVVLSSHDMSCGWDMHTHSFSDTSYIESEDALKLGANLMAYATATRDLSTSVAEAKLYKDATDTKADKFRVGQLVHEGYWNPDEVGLQNMLDTVGETTSLKVSFAVDAVRPTFEELSKYPFLYVTGHNDFRWSDAQVAAIKRYLANGGFILGEACCGREAFDLAFRREMAKVLKADDNPNGVLRPLQVTHPVFAIQNKVSRVQFTEAARAKYGRKLSDNPLLDAALLDGRVAVLYSPIGMNAGWRVRPVPYSAAYEPKSALDLGVNIVVYALTQ